MDQNIGWLRINERLKLRYGIWKPAGCDKGKSVVVLGGRGEFLEKYLEIVQELTGRGMTVFSFDWRGQGLSSRQTPKPNIGHVDSFQHYLKDLDVFLDRIVRPQTDHTPIMLAHSMGAHLGLRYLEEHPVAFDRAVLVSPMIAINNVMLPEDLIYRVSKTAVSLGMAKVEVPFTSGRNEYLGRFEGNFLTCSRRRFQKNKSFLKANPHLLVDSLSFGWIKSALESIRYLAGSGFAGKIKLPVLVVAAGSDKVVSVRATCELFKRMPSSITVVIGNAKHEILQEKDAIRNRFWRLFNAFVDNVHGDFPDNNPEKPKAG